MGWRPGGIGYMISEEKILRVLVCIQFKALSLTAPEIGPN